MEIVSDEMTKLGQSVVHHGKFNDRAYLLKLDSKDVPGIIGALDQLASENDYSKIIAKISEEFLPLFLASGYQVEADIPGFYQGAIAGYFVSKFRTSDRAKSSHHKSENAVLQAATEKQAKKPRPLPTGFSWREANQEDIRQMAEVYEEVFATYPFPIKEPSYLAQTMQENVDYFCVTNKTGEIVSLSSAEQDLTGGNVEMTDFATLPAYRGCGLAAFLLDKMDEQMAQKGLTKAYTIARASSYGMNITFARQGYAFSGTLVNNTNIAGRLESMHVWHKDLLA